MFEISFLALAAGVERVAWGDGADLCEDISRVVSDGCSGAWGDERYCGHGDLFADKLLRWQDGWEKPF